MERQFLECLDDGVFEKSEVCVGPVCFFFYSPPFLFRRLHLRASDSHSLFLLVIFFELSAARNY